MIAEAFCSYFAHEYLVKKKSVPERIFAYIASACRKSETLNDSCRTAYMKYLSQKTRLTAEEEKLLEELLKQSLRRGLFFAFYRQLDRSF